MEKTTETKPEVLRDAFSSYPKLWALGHYAIEDIFASEVVVEEKIDGSQFSFGIINGELKCRSKSVLLNLFAPEKMFIPAVEVAKGLAESGILREGWCYRGEYLKIPKHNTLAYSRIPVNHIIGFDIATGFETYLPHDEKREEFARIGLECVPEIFRGMTGPGQIRGYLENVSVLGGQVIEGVVVKNQSKISKLGQIMIGKFVSEAFKEVHQGDWRERCPDKKDVLQIMIEKYRTPARWEKAVQHLKENGSLENDLKDIGKLMKEVPMDVLAECKEEISKALFEWAWGTIHRGICHGLPQWYKEKLMMKSLEGESGDTV